MKCPLCNGTGECEVKPTSKHKKDVARILVENGWSYSEIATVLGWKSKNSVRHALDTLLDNLK